MANYPINVRSDEHLVGALVRQAADIITSEFSRVDGRTAEGKRLRDVCKELERIGHYVDHYYSDRVGK